MVEVYVKVN